MSKLVVQLITWNGCRYIPHLFNSLREQTLREWDFIIIDNGSTDGTIEALKGELALFDRPHRFILNNANRGFAGGHNQAFAILEKDFAQLLNQDVVLASDYLERILAFMERTPTCAAAQGSLCRWNFRSVTEETSDGRTDAIDTFGLRVLRNRRVVEAHTGESHTAFGVGPTASTEVFGVSGALPMYRAEALRDVALRKSEGSELEIFDEDFFSYKEDVDLAFRLRSRGWRAFIVPEARAWHDRTAAGPKIFSDTAAANDRRTKSSFIRYHSYKNHLFVLLKNESSATFWPDALAILWYECKKFIYLLFREPETLVALGAVIRLLPLMLRKRRAILAKRRVPSADMRRWYV